MTSAHERHPHDHGDVESEVATILDALRDYGGRITSGRRAVARALVTANDHHLTAEDVAEIVQSELPDVHLSTIYRTLEALEARGVVGRVNLGSGSAVYHLMDHTHHHLVCSECGAVVEAGDEAFASLREELDALYGFAVSEQHLAIAGRCSACRGR